MKKAVSNFKLIRSGPRRAFSLIEMVAVVCILGLLGTAGVVSLTRSLRRANHESTFKLIQTLNDRARNHSESGNCSLIFDIDRNRIFVESLAEQGKTTWQVADWSPNSISGSVGSELVLPSSLRLRRLLHHGVNRESGAVSIVFENGGTSSYAVLLESSNTNGTWLVFAGSTRLCYLVAKTKGNDVDQQVQKWFAKWAIAR